MQEIQQVVQGAHEAYEWIKWILGILIAGTLGGFGVFLGMINALKKSQSDHRQHVAESYTPKDDFKSATEASQKSMDRQFGEINKKLDKVFDLFMEKANK